jgi:hypothetical protein
LNKLGITSGFFSCGGYDSGGSQVKEKLYQDCYPMDVFFPFIIKVGCFHEQPNNFFRQWANMVWTTKGIEGPPLSMLHLFFR